MPAGVAISGAAGGCSSVAVDGGGAAAVTGGAAAEESLTGVAEGTVITGDAVVPTDRGGNTKASSAVAVSTGATPEKRAASVQTEQPTQAQRHSTSDPRPRD